MRQFNGIVALLLVCASIVLAQAAPDGQKENQPTRPKRIRVSSPVIRGLVANEALPVYPRQALTSGIHGDVIFVILIDETGKIVRSNPVEGDPLLVAVSVDALRDFRFRPYLLNGEPIQVESQLEFHFSIKDRKQNQGKVEYVADIPYRPEFRPGALSQDGTLILWPRRISGAEPALPPELAGKSGSVYLSITIGADGRVQNVGVIGGDEAFIAPVVDAVKQFVYEPQLVDGTPSSSRTEASFHFGETPK